MKSVLVFVFALALAVTPFVNANFHISKVNHHFDICPGEDAQCLDLDQVIACPSNYFNCDCWQNGKRAAYMNNWEIDDLEKDYFQLQAGLCGMPALNFYKTGSGWDFYVANGDGTKQGTCYDNNHPGAGGTCYTWYGTLAEDFMWCDSYICGE